MAQLHCYLPDHEAESLRHRAERAGMSVSRYLAARGTPIGPNDTLIAAIAVAHQAVLVTRNQREFGRVENLRLEVW